MSSYEAYFNGLAEGESALSEREYNDALSSGYRPVSCAGASLLGLTYRVLPLCRAKLTPTAANALERLVSALDPFPVEAVISAIRHLLPSQYLPSSVEVKDGVLSAVGGVRNVRASANGYFYLETSCACGDAVIYIYVYPDRVRVAAVLNIMDDGADGLLSQETSVLEVGRDGSAFVADPVAIDAEDERADELTVLRAELLKVRKSEDEGQELIGVDDDGPFDYYGVFAVVRNSVYVPLYETPVYKDARSVISRACFLLEKRPLSIDVFTMKNILTHEEGETYNDKVAVVDQVGEYVTRNGSIVRVDVADWGGLMPVRGYVVGGTLRAGLPMAWNRAGYCLSPYTPHPMDIIRPHKGGDL